MFPLSSLTKSAIILHAQPAYQDVYLGIDQGLEQVLKDALEKNNVVVKDSINSKASFQEGIIEVENLLSQIENSDFTALRCIILMLR